MKKYALVARYVANEMGDRQPNTRQQATNMINTVLESLERDHGVVIEDEKVTGLNGLVMSDWKGRISQDRKPSTVNCYIAMMRPFLSWLFNAGLTQSNCGAGLKFMKVPSIESIPESERPKDKYLTHEQAAELLKCESGRNRTRDRAIISMILYTGLRTEELCSLNVGDFMGPNVQHGQIEVKRKGGLYKKVNVPDPVYDYLQAYLSERRDGYDMDSPLFISAQGRRCTRQQLYKSISKKQKAVGNIATGAHALRHTFVSEVEKIGGAAVARDLANHSSLNITNRYMHTTQDQLRNTVRALAW